MSKKIASIAVSLTTTVWLSGAAMFAPIASADTVSDLQAQIQALLAQISTLQAQLAALKGETTTAVSCTFTRDLTVGVKGDDVKCLQQYLNSAGYKLADSGAGSPGNETTYFGSLTKAAVAKWQAANNVSPAVGYFGPISRAKYSSLVAAAATTTTTETTTTETTTTEETTTTPAAKGLSVSLAADSPTGSAISGALQIDAAKYTFTAGEDATITALKFQKVGVVSDSHLSNLYLANEAGTIVAQYSSLSNGVVTFSNLSEKVSAGESKSYTLRIDLSSSATAGNTIAWKLTDVTAGDVEVSGLPVSSNTLTVTSVSSPSLAQVDFTFNTVGSSVDAGTTSVQVVSITASVTNSAAKLNNIRFTVTGSADFSDLRNVKLLVNGEQVGSTIDNVPADGKVDFAPGVELSTGNSTLEVYADVLGSPNRDFKFQILRPYDVQFTDTEYNSGISTGSTLTGASTSVSIQKGEITITVASDTPTGDIAKGSSNVTLAKFNFYAAGEQVKVKYIDLKLTQTGGDTWATLANVTEDISNISVIDDAGGQMGNTISTVTSGTGNGQCTLAASTITCHLGTSSSNINYLIPANTTRVLSVTANIKSDADISTIQASFNAGTNNLEGQTSFQSSSSGAADGSSLTIISSALTVAKNTSFGNPTYVAGASDVKLASFTVTGSSAEGGKISTLTVNKDDNSDMDIQNLKIVVSGTQFGSTKPTVGDSATVTFSATSPVIVSAGTSVDIDVYADILSTTATGTQTSVIDLSGWSAIGEVSGSSISFSTAAGASEIAGQNVVISSGATLTVAKSSSSAAAKNLVMGSTGNSLFTVDLSANNVEDVQIKKIKFTDTISNGSATKASFSGLSLYEGGTKIAGPLGLTLSSASTGTVEFALTTPITVSKNTTKSLELKGDVASYESGGAVSNSSHTFKINATGDITAIGKDSNNSATVSGTPSASAMKVYRTKLSLASTGLGSSTGRVRSSIDDLATISLTADENYQVKLRGLKVTFAGSAITSATGNVTVDLIDPSTNSALGDASQQTCTSSTLTATFGTLGSTGNGINYTIAAGSTKNVTLRIDSSNLYNAANTSDSLSVTIQAAGDVSYSDGTTSDIELESSVVPFAITTVSYE